MRACFKLLSIVAVVAAATACNKQESAQDQNIVIDSGNIPDNADIAPLKRELERAIPKTLWTINRREKACVEPPRVAPQSARLQCRRRSTSARGQSARPAAAT